MIEWLWAQVLLLMQDPQVRAGVAGLVAGIGMTEAVAHCLNPAMAAYRAERIIRLLAFGIAICTTFALYTTREGLAWGGAIGVIAPLVHHFGARALYARWPALEPKALKP